MHKSFGLIPTGRLGKPPCQGLDPEVMIYLTSCGYLLVTLCIYVFLFIFFHALRELVGINTSNYRLIDYNFIDLVILFRAPVFHHTFWTDNISLSSSNQSRFYVFNFIHFISFWRFSDILIVEDRKIPMRDRCIKCGDLRSLFPPPFVEPLALYFGFVSLTTVCDFFLLMVFILLCRLSSISFLVFFFFFFILV